MCLEDAINRAIPIDYEQLINERGQFITELKQIMQTTQ
jgi:hypothetical protein